MDLFSNDNPWLTQSIIDRQLLKTPFVLLDVGVRGGIQRKWKMLGRCLDIYGFDPDPEAIELINEPGRYSHVALGEFDGEREFTITNNAFSSSFYPSMPGRTIKVPVRSIDSLIATGEIAAPDFIKMDCEGAEPEILRGASGLLASNQLVGVESETSFGVSVLYPENHFAALNQQLVRAGLTVFDLAHDRVPAKWGIGKINTFNMVWCRDYAYDKRYAVPWPVVPPTNDQVLKLAIIFDLYGLVELALETLLAFGLMPPDIDLARGH